MLVNCNVWVEGDGDVWQNGCKWSEQHLERKTIDTDLYEWFGEVTFVNESSLYPYKNQCRVPHRVLHKNALMIEKETLEKIRSLLGGDKVVVI